MKLVKWQLSGFDQAEEFSPCGYALTVKDARSDAEWFLDHHAALEPGWREELGVSARASWATVYKFEVEHIWLDRVGIVQELNYALNLAHSPVWIIQ